MSIETTPKVREITLKSGKILRLHELSLLDISDGEDLLKKPSDEWFPKNADDKETKVTSRMLGVLVWLMVRKDGLTRDQILARQWPVSIDDVMEQMTLKDLAQHSQTIVNCFLSGSE